MQRERGGSMVHKQGADSEHREQLDEEGEEVANEDKVVPISHAVVYPDAVVVEALHALVAGVAMLGLGAHHHLAVGAERFGIEFGQEMQKFN